MTSYKQQNQRQHLHELPHCADTICYEMLTHFKNRVQVSNSHAHPWHCPPEHVCPGPYGRCQGRKWRSQRKDQTFVRRQGNDKSLCTKARGWEGKMKLSKPGDCRAGCHVRARYRYTGVLGRGQLIRSRKRRISASSAWSETPAAWSSPQTAETRSGRLTTCPWLSYNNQSSLNCCAERGGTSCCWFTQTRRDF